MGLLDLTNFQCDFGEKDASKKFIRKGKFNTFISIKIIKLCLQEN